MRIWLFDDETEERCEWDTSDVYVRGLIWTLSSMAGSPPCSYRTVTNDDKSEGSRNAAPASPLISADEFVRSQTSAAGSWPCQQIGGIFVSERQL